MAEPATMAVPSPAAERRWSLDRRLVARFVPLWALTMVAAQLTIRGFGRPTHVLLVEGLVYLALYLGLLSFAPVHAWVTAIPSPHRTVFAAFVLLATWGQLVVDSRTTFPFTAWTMYARPERRALLEYYRYRGTDARGQVVWVDPAEELTFVNSAEIASRVKYIGRPATSPTADPRRDAARAQVRDLLTAIAAAYDRSHPDAPLRSLEFMHYAWDYRHQDPAAVVPTAVLRVEFPEGPAR
jgi:hypothetical protein